MVEVEVMKAHYTGLSRVFMYNVTALGSHMPGNHGLAVIGFASGEREPSSPL